VFWTKSMARAVPLASTVSVRARTVGKAMSPS
jgi:hypothetical protein